MSIVAIDVDLTLIDTGTSWLKWLNRKSGKRLSLEDCGYDYNLATSFPEVKDPYSYWRQKDLYDGLIPRDDALRIVARLCKEHSVVFVSAVKGDHHKSKYNFLKRWFPNMQGFIATKEKNFVKCDMLIDDRNSFLNLMPEEVIKIKIDTPYTQDQPLSTKVIHCRDWFDIYNKLQEIGFGK